MNLIRQKQIHKLEEDISSLYLGSDVFKRSTALSLGVPGEGEACLDSSDASQVTTLHIHTTDSITGNRFTTLSEFQQYDHLIVNIGTEVIKYEINSIQEAVDQSNEGHFILTLQHSFGYSDSLTRGQFTYYFRKSAADELIENNSIQITVERNRAIAAEALLADSIGNRSAVVEYVFTGGSALTVPHTFNVKYVMVQVINNSGVVCTHECVISNFTTNSVDISVPISGSYKILLNKIGDLSGEITMSSMYNNGFNDYEWQVDEDNDTGFDVNIGGDVTLSYWVRGDVLTSHQYPGTYPVSIGISSNSTLGRLHGAGTNKKYMLQLPFADGTGDPNTNKIAQSDIWDGDWHHVVFTKTAAGVLKLYIDTELVTWVDYYDATSTSTSILYEAFGTERLWIGKGTSTTSYWTGDVDEVAVFDYILTENAIQLIFEKTEDAETTADLDTLSSGAPVYWNRLDIVSEQ